MCQTNGAVQYTHALNDGVHGVEVFWHFTRKVPIDSLLGAQLLPRVCLIRFFKQQHVTLIPPQPPLAALPPPSPPAHPSSSTPPQSLGIRFKGFGFEGGGLGLGFRF
jgi:hypothetical protein